METDCPATDESKNARSGAGVLACPPERAFAVLTCGGIQLRTIPALVICPRLPRRQRLGLCGVCLFTILAVLSTAGAAQTSGKTVRHHKVEVDDPSSPPELIQAEAAIEKQDYSTAEPLLKKVVGDDPQNYAAWFDLGFVYNAQGRTDGHQALRECGTAHHRHHDVDKDDVGSDRVE